MDIHIRPARGEDHPFIVAAQLTMALETEGLRLDPPTVEQGVRAVLEDPSKGAYWLATDASGAPIGVLLTVPEWSDWRNGTVLWIHSAYVVPERRRTGVFRALYRHLQTEVERDGSGLRGLRLYVDQRNAAAQAVYESLGMQRDHYHLYEWLR